MLTLEEHELKLQELLAGAGGQDQNDFEAGVDYLRGLSLAEKQSGSLLALIIDKVRATMPEPAQAFGEYFGGSSGQARHLGYIDCCGTGGSGMVHFNTSTTVAFVLAAAGQRVAKFGNRAASSASGSFDLLSHLGIGKILPLDAQKQLLETTGLGFLFAPQFYPGLANIAPLRKAVGARTLFNFIGPLLNPVSPAYRLMGIPDTLAQEMVADYLSTEKYCKKALVVRADSGLDELDPDCNNKIIEVAPDKKKQYVHKADDGGDFAGSTKTRRNDFSDALGPADNAKIFLALLGGKLGPDDYHHRLVCLNAGAAFYAAGTVPLIEEGKQLAARVIASGAAREKFEDYKQAFEKLAAGEPV